MCSQAGRAHSNLKPGRLHIFRGDESLVRAGSSTTKRYQVDILRVVQLVGLGRLKPNTDVTRGWVVSDARFQP